MTARAGGRLLWAAAALLGASSAAADWRDTLELGVGVRGSLGGSYSATPDVLRAEIDGVTVEPAPYEGWWGFGAGGGLNLDARLFGWLGLELGVLVTKDEGVEDLEEAELVGTNIALHLPLAVVLTLPARGLRPLLLLGYEAVVPLSTSSSYSGDRYEVATEADAYGLLHTGLGFEVDLPIEGYDLRIPFAFRMAFNLANDSTVLAGRARYEGGRRGPAVQIDRAVFSTEYDAHLTLTTGLTWYFR